MNEFYYDVNQRKRLAHQAVHRKRGSKSTKCPMSTDHMTQQQWEARCGEVVTCQLGQPMTWEEFRKLPAHIQKEYLLDMIQRYSATASDLARMFGVTPGTVTKYCKDSGNGISFQPGKRMPKAKRLEFAKMLSAQYSGSDLLPVAAPQEQQSQLESQLKPQPVTCVGDEETVEKPVQPPSDMAMTDFSLCFEGRFSPDAVANSLRAMLRPGVQVKIEIKCAVSPLPSA